MGEDGMKKFSELLASTIEFSQHNLFVFSPAMSYPSEDWIKADPDFWKPKAHMPAARRRGKRSQPPANNWIRRAGSQHGTPLRVPFFVWPGYNTGNELLSNSHLSSKTGDQQRRNP